MSWLTEIAGKAENFLNAVDKSAASALTPVASNGGSRKHSVKSESHEIMMSSNHLDTEFIDTPDVMSLRTSASTNSLFSENGNGKKKSQHTRTSSYDSNASRDSKFIDQDDRLMEYLNNKNDIPEEWQSLNDNNSTENNDDKTSETKSGKNESMKQIKELDSLNKRFLELQTDYKKLKLKAINYYNQNTSNEKLIKELKCRESDLTANLNAKDSQVAALKIHAEQIGLELHEMEEKYNEMKVLNEQLKQTSQNKAEENEIIVQLQKEIESLKQALKINKDELKRVQESDNQQIIRLEGNQASLIDELENCRRQLNELKTARTDLETTNDSIRRKYDQLEREFNDFKLKASKTLNEKQETLKKLNAVNVTNAEMQQGPNNQDVQIRMLMKQNDTLMNELIDYRTKYETIQSLMEKIENETIPKKDYELRALKEELEQEKTTSSNLMKDVSQLSKESISYQDDLNQIKTSLSARISERDEEIDKLRKQLMLKQRGNSNLLSSSISVGDLTLANASTEEWEQRLKALTESLISKQSMVEQLSSANHSLKLQLERSEQRLREFVSSNTALNNDVAIGIYHSPTFTNLIKHRMTNGGSGNESMALMREDPQDNNVTRKVKRAYGAIDAFSIRLGNFLRVYPSARAAFLVYIVVMHLWVAFILIYYEPEIHNTGFE